MFADEIVKTSDFNKVRAQMVVVCEFAVRSPNPPR